MTHLDQQHPHCLVCKHFSFILVTGENRTVVILIEQSDVDLCCCHIVGRILLSCYNLSINKSNQHVSWKKVPVCLSVRFNPSYLKCEGARGLSVQSCGVLNCDRPIWSDGEGSRLWKDLQRPHKSALGEQVMEEITSTCLTSFCKVMWSKNLPGPCQWRWL